MTLAMTLGMSIGVRKTMWMMWGELLGVATVAISAVIGVSAVMLKYPFVFSIIKIAGALYLFWIGINMWRSRGKLALSTESSKASEVSKITLFNQGYMTAIANPKGWAFMVSLLPPFINPQMPMATQMVVLVLVICCSEFICMMLYASGGKTIGKTLTQNQNVAMLNKVSGSLMMAVGVWLALS